MQPNGGGEPFRNTFNPEPAVPWYRMSDDDLEKIGKVRVRTGFGSYKIMPKKQYEREQKREKERRERPLKQKAKDYLRKKWDEKKREQRRKHGLPRKPPKPRRQDPKRCRHKRWRTVSEGFLFVRKYRVCTNCGKKVPVPS